jgi:hypothetical protein
MGLTKRVLVFISRPSAFLHKTILRPILGKWAYVIVDVTNSSQLQFWRGIFNRPGFTSLLGIGNV